MFESILIANRGEIACRIARTCRRLGIRTIAVYSDADSNSRHVREADSAIRIGPPDAASSYLNAEAIIEAACAAGASAIHPGYGFLSESLQLVERCATHAIAWIGPRAEVIGRMGSKIESKRIAAAAGVLCVPGYHHEEQDPATLLEHAREIGVPLLIKASAGGGGKGMRRVDSIDDFLPQLSLARREAMRAFGDDRVLIEKLIERPRHLEVQLAGDHHGDLVHLFERECSIQRNYQKVIEEAPAPRLPLAVRDKLFDAAIKLGRAIRYDSLGTVEFVLAEGSDTPYFLEMNTRLQVEHPVTEMTTGFDLVEWQIRIAQGEPLPVAQHEIFSTGWAIEARINCEDPAHGHRPEFGTVGQYSEPTGSGIRTDSGIAAGSSIPSQYDSMVAKLIGSGPTRAHAVERLHDAISGFEAGGIGTNQALLLTIVDHPLFRRGQLTTGFLAEAFPGGWQERVEDARGAIVAAAIATVQLHGSGSQPGSVSPKGYWQRQGGFRFMAAAGRSATARVRVINDSIETAIAIARDGSRLRIEIDGVPAMMVTVEWPSPERLRLTAQHGMPSEFLLSRDGDMTVVNHRGTRWQLLVLSEVAALARVDRKTSSSSRDILSELPGAITAINVTAGAHVLAGDILVVMESMKLIFPLVAPRDGTIATLRCAIGDIVARGQTLVQLEPLAEPKPT
jgi:3-methylcrotonyl-CoA carboxylase alpha subunit